MVRGLLSETEGLGFRKVLGRSSYLQAWPNGMTKYLGLYLGVLV